jgi:hypothetical protein
MRIGGVMGSEITNTVTIYEISGVKYTGALKIHIKSHPRFLNFVRLCIDNHEYSVASIELIGAVDGAVGRLLAPAEDALIGGQANLMNQFKELTTEKQEPGAD